MVSGSALRLIRKNKKMTLKDVSESTGISVSFLSDIEREVTRPSLESLEKLADVYEMEVSILRKAEAVDTCELIRNALIADGRYPGSTINAIVHIIKELRLD